MERWILVSCWVLAMGGCVAQDAGSWVDVLEDGSALDEGGWSAEAYAVVPGAGGAVFEASNASNGFLAVFDADGVEVSPLLDAEDWW
ncbi:MAG: hypothetical protein JRI25_17280, partial [Deltaproteobacteria bacterium]|nr:hypothetical protein [Deltaproteobacteria bacterium]